ncbi:hypothetical protein ACFL6U_27740 [Planctomycetota bacterium]
MPSSTSNSENIAMDTAYQRCPRSGGERVLWLMVFVITVSALYGWETFLRRHGHRPTVVDNHALWALQRDRVDSPDSEKTLVCLGDCRMQLGFMPSLVNVQQPDFRVVQLAVHESSPMMALRDLAAHEDFNGIVLCGLTPREFCDDIWDSQQAYVDFYHRQFGLNVKLNRCVSNWMQCAFTFLHPHVRLDDMFVHWLQNRTVKNPYYLETRADRSRLADYSGADLPQQKAWALGRLDWYLLDRGAVVPSEAWVEGALRTNAWVQAIQDRGGDVVFVRFPTSGQHLMKEQLGFPRQEYWDAFAAQTPAYTIHFQDEPTLEYFYCPDTSHLDRRDTPRFTLALLDILVRDGILPDPQIAAPTLPMQRKKPQTELGGDDFDPFAD